MEGEVLSPDIVPNRANCSQNSNYTWTTPRINFDNVLNGMIALFQVVNIVNFDLIGRECWFDSVKILLHAGESKLNFMIYAGSEVAKARSWFTNHCGFNPLSCNQLYYVNSHCI